VRLTRYRIERVKKIGKKKNRIKYIRRTSQTEGNETISKTTLAVHLLWLYPYRVCKSNAIKFDKKKLLKISLPIFKILQSIPLWHSYTFAGDFSMHGMHPGIRRRGDQFIRVFVIGVWIASMFSKRTPFRVVLILGNKKKSDQDCREAGTTSAGCTWPGIPGEHRRAVWPAALS